MTRLHKRLILKERSRVLRRRQTRAEAILWKNLRRRHLEGKKFRRQHSIGPYIVDFYCAKKSWSSKLMGLFIMILLNANMMWNDKSFWRTVG